MSQPEPPQIELPENRYRRKKGEPRRKREPIFNKPGPVGIINAIVLVIVGALVYGLHYASNHLPLWGFFTLVAVVVIASLIAAVRLGGR